MERPKIEWNVVKEFEEKNALVQVSVSDTPQPRYTIRVGRRGREPGVVVSFLVVDSGGRTSLVDTIARLVDLAEQWVIDDAKANRMQARAQGR